MDANVGALRGRVATDVAGKDGAAVTREWAIVGAGFIALMLYVVYHWVTAPYFVPVPEGVEVLLNVTIGVRALEIGKSIVGVASAGSSWSASASTRGTRSAAESGTCV